MLVPTPVFSPSPSFTTARVAEDAAERMMRRGLFLRGTALQWKFGKWWSHPGCASPAVRPCHRMEMGGRAGADNWLQNGWMQPPKQLRMSAEGGRGAPPQAPQHHLANSSLSPGSALQGTSRWAALAETRAGSSRKSPLVQGLPESPAWPPDRDPQAGREGGTASSPRFASVGVPGGQLWHPRLRGALGPPQQPRVGRSFCRPASAEVFAAIGTGAAARLPGSGNASSSPRQTSSPSTQTTSRFKCLPEKLSQGKCSSPDWAEEAPFHHRDSAGTFALIAAPQVNSSSNHKQNSVCLPIQPGLAPREQAPLKKHVLITWIFSFLQNCQRKSNREAKPQVCLFVSGFLCPAENTPTCLMCWKKAKHGIWSGAQICSVSLCLTKHVHRVYLCAAASSCSAVGTVLLIPQQSQDYEFERHRNHQLQRYPSSLKESKPLWVRQIICQQPTEESCLLQRVEDRIPDECSKGEGTGGNGRGEHSNCSLHAMVPRLGMEHTGEEVSGLFAQGTVMYCKDVDLGCSGSGTSWVWWNCKGAQQCWAPRHHSWPLHCGVGWVPLCWGAVICRDTARWNPLLPPAGRLKLVWPQLFPWSTLIQKICLEEAQAAWKQSQQVQRQLSSDLTWCDNKYPAIKELQLHPQQHQHQPTPPRDVAQGSQSQGKTRGAETSCREAPGKAAQQLVHFQEKKEILAG